MSNHRKESLKLSSRYPSLVIAMDEESSKVQNKRFCKCDCGGVISDRYPNGRKRNSDIEFIKGHSNKGENNGQWKGGRFINENGYVMILQPDHPHANHLGYVKEHHLVIEKDLGRHLRPNEEVHHINKIKTDNIIENLQVVDALTHRRLHSGCEQINEEWWKPCRRCGEFYEVDSGYYKSKNGIHSWCKKCDCKYAKGKRNKK